jgi:hypothetical protein
MLARVLLESTASLPIPGAVAIATFGARSPRRALGQIQHVSSPLLCGEGATPSPHTSFC